MRILSIDVGIKNLALCVMESVKAEPHYNIKYWEVINLCNEQNIMCSIESNNKKCLKQAKFVKNNINYCKQHASKTDYKIPTSELNKYKRLKLEELKTLAKEYGIIYDKPETKINLQRGIEKHMADSVFQNISTIKCNEFNLVDVGRIIKIKLDELDELKKIDILEIDVILIENQISPIANRMAIIQGMITQYYLMKNKNKINYISGANKLRLFIGNKKTTYNQRKKISIEITNKLLKDNKYEWNEFFNKHKKRDDLADCFLQGIWYLYTQELIEINLNNI